MNDKTSIKTIKMVQGIGQTIDWNTKENKKLVEAFLTLKSTDEAQLFLRDIMTKGEIEEFANRLKAASLLSQDVQYSTIIKRTGLSSTTIARTAKWLKGSLGGYRLVLSRLNHHNSSKLRKGLILSS